MSFDPSNLYTYSFLAAFIICILCLAVTLLLKLKKSKRTSDIRWLDKPDNTLQLSNSLNIAYRQSGFGKDLLLIHGLGANTYCWRLIYSSLCKNYKVTCLDLPGFGYSSKSQNLDCGLDQQTINIKLFIDELGLNKPILVGSSLGGTLALWLSLKFPNDFTKIIAIAPAAGVQLVPIIFRKVKSVSYYLNWGLNRQTMILILKHIFVNKKLVTEHTVDGYLTPYLHNKTDSIHGFVSAKGLIMDKRLPGDFYNLKSEPLILAARKDKMVRKKDIKSLLKVIPQYQFFLNDSAGHHIMEDDPNWVIEKINTYLNK